MFWLKVPEAESIKTREAEQQNGEAVVSTAHRKQRGKTGSEVRL